MSTHDIRFNQRLAGLLSNFDQHSIACATSSNPRLEPPTDGRAGVLELPFSLLRSFHVQVSQGFRDLSDSFLFRGSGYPGRDALMRKIRLGRLLPRRWSRQVTTKYPAE